MTKNGTSEQTQLNSRYIKEHRKDNIYGQGNYGNWMRKLMSTYLTVAAYDVNLN